MISKLIRSLVVGVILGLIYWAGSLIIAATAAPAFIALILAVVLILVFALFLAREFGVSD